jgi:hypothetical protein
MTASVTARRLRQERRRDPVAHAGIRGAVDHNEQSTVFRSVYARPAFFHFTCSVSKIMSASGSRRTVAAISKAT